MIKVVYGQNTMEIPIGQGTLLEQLRPHFPIKADCGGMGRCGKCTVELLRGGIRKKTLACKEIPMDGDVVYLPMVNSEESHQKPQENGTWAAVDIGTTTVGYRVFDDKDNLVNEGCFVNPQVRYGADVLSRIRAAKEGHLEEMQSILSRKLCAAIGDHLNEIIVSANTVMSHIFTGVSPVTMGQYPFAPVFTELRKIKGETIGISAKWVTLLPSADAFLGADAVCGAHFLKGKNALLVDLGTNGEVILKQGDRYFGASAPAGPALEGGNISCGMGSVDGAIYGVSQTDGRLTFRVKGTPKGLGGTGLTDAVALMLDEKILDGEGRFRSAPKWQNRMGENGFLLANGIVLTQGDIRAFQLAKSAVRTTVEILLQKAGLSASELDEVSVAGSMGEGLNIASAVRTGMFPSEFLPIARAVGNLSLTGAERAKIYGCADYVRLANAIERIELTACSDFDRLFIGFLNFPY